MQWVVTDRGVVLRDPQLEELMAAHRHYGGVSALQMPAGFLRNATAYGASPRQRFDIVLNNLSGLAWTTKEIKMTSDGQPWRPLVHVLDICDAIGCVLEAPRSISTRCAARCAGRSASR